MHGGGKDVFAQYFDISGNGYRELIEGESVTFDVAPGRKASAGNIVRRRPRRTPRIALGPGGDRTVMRARRLFARNRCTR
ncbi:hypothetical protein GFH48_02220 [Streptomyces fagopyri]|uniref:CSD domain-containing protein n=1 Tax=Streptomyces fagopyri TaxID=2662397 RepID=A0A5Q0L678_9ACTN|nr:hypothetical protein GFH48_02220 [Streptomyces fagopyri]